MWRRSIKCRVHNHKGSDNSSGSHSIRQYWDRWDQNPDPQRINIVGWNHGSHPGEIKPIVCVWDDSPRQTLFRSLNFHSNRGTLLHAPIVFQRDYTCSHHKKTHGHRATDVLICYLFVGSWVGSTECSLPHDLVYYRVGYSKEHWQILDEGRIPWPHRNRKWQRFSGPNLWHHCHDKSDYWQCQSHFDTIKECTWKKLMVQDVSQ